MSARPIHVAPVAPDPRVRVEFPHTEAAEAALELLAFAVSELRKEKERLGLRLSTLERNQARGEAVTFAIRQTEDRIAATSEKLGRLNQALLALKRDVLPAVERYEAAFTRFVLASAVDGEQLLREARNA